MPREASWCSLSSYTAIKPGFVDLVVWALLGNPGVWRWRVNFQWPRCAKTLIHSFTYRITIGIRRE